MSGSRTVRPLGDILTVVLLVLLLAGCAIPPTTAPPVTHVALPMATLSTAPALGMAASTATAVLPTVTASVPPVPAIVTQLASTATAPASIATMPAAFTPPTELAPTAVAAQPAPTTGSVAAATFTPPPPPPEPPGRHFVLGRPVPLDTVAWTDKSYPYGGTKGGALMTHHGVEFAVQAGTHVLAAGAGTVVVAGTDAEIAYGPQTNFYGNLVVIEHAPSGGRPFFTLYGHLSEVQVEVGQVVAEGEPIALSGSTGVAFGPHLHFEVRVGSNGYDATRNPVLWLRPLNGDGVVTGRVTSANGELVAGVPVTLHRQDAPSLYAASATYAQDGVNGDDLLGENFALDDLGAGYYEVIVGNGAKRQVLDLWVYAGQVNQIDITLR